MANLWEIPDITDIEFTSDINVLLNLIRSGELDYLQVKNKFEPTDKVNSTFERELKDKGFGINYVSDENPILISHNPMISNFISQEYYNQHKKEITDAYLERFSKLSDDISIRDYQYSPELLDLVINNRIDYVNFYNVELTDKDVQKLNDNYISASLFKNGKYKSVSSSKVIGDYSYNTITNENEISLVLSISDILNVKLSAIKLFNRHKKISFNDTAIERDEENSYKAIKIFLDNLENEGKECEVLIPVYRRSIFREVFGDLNYNNLKIGLKNDNEYYSVDEYLSEEDTLDNLVKPIKEANLSPLERYMAVYNLVKNFKPYKESPNQDLSSRRVKYILNNEYMVCVGFAKLLEVLCEKVGLSVNYLGTTVDSSYDKGEVSDIEFTQMAGHGRCVISIDDDKYDVHGLFICDPTWDNKIDENRLNYALLTFAKASTGKRMIWFDIEDPILDINNFEDFNTQVNFLFKKYMVLSKENVYFHLSDYVDNEERQKMDKDPKYNREVMERITVLFAYKKMIEAILQAISSIPNYYQFLKELDNCTKEEDYTSLLSDIGNYLVTRINQPVSNETIIQASVNASSKLRKLNDEEKEKEYEQTRKEFYERELNQFPYMVEDANNLGWKSR